MLDTFISQIGNELEMTDFITSPEPGHFQLQFAGDIQVDAAQSQQGYYGFKGIIGDCPKEKAQEFLIKTMEANLFVRQTRGAIIGLNEDGKVLTLTLEVDYNSSYKEWKEKLEDFVNVLEFWRNEAKVS